MEALPVELACAIIQNTQDPAEILRLYNASATVRQYVEACADAISSPRLRAIPLRSTFPLLALPRLRLAQNIAFAVDAYTDVAALRAVSPQLDNVVFIVSATYLLMPLIQRLMDLLGNAFLAKRWLFAVPEEESQGEEPDETSYNYLIIADSAVLSNAYWVPGERDPLVEGILAYLADAGFESVVVGDMYVGYPENPDDVKVASSLLLDVITTAPFPNVDPYRPQSGDNPPLTSSLLLWQWGLVIDMYSHVLSLGIMSELMVRGKNSPNLARWAEKLGRMPGIHQAEGHTYALYIDDVATSWDLIESVRPPVPMSAEVTARAAEETRFLRDLSGSYTRRPSDPIYIGNTPYSFALLEEDALSAFPTSVAAFVRRQFALRGRGVIEGARSPGLSPTRSPTGSPVLVRRGDIYRSPQ